MRCRLFFVAVGLLVVPLTADAQQKPRKPNITGLIGKWHLGEEDAFHPQARGFDDYFGFLTGAHTYLASDDKNYGPVYRGKKKVEVPGYLTDVFANEATQFIERNKDKPFFLY